MILQREEEIEYMRGLQSLVMGRLQGMSVWDRVKNKVLERRLLMN